MKILWTSNSPMIDSGYGKQTRLFTQQMIKDGHEVICFGNFGHFGAALEWNGMTILPASSDAYGKDALADLYQQHKPDAHILLYDIWPFENDILEQARVTAYAPVDHDDLPPLVAERLRHTPFQWAMSRHAERCMKKAGLNPFYVPHVVDTSLFIPIARDKARQIVKVGDDVFLAVMVAAHKGFPMRKSFDRVLRAWGEFARRRSDVCLHMHTDARGTAINNYIDLEDVARFYEVPDKSLRFPNGNRYRSGYFSDEYLNALYNAADVMLLPSAGEGFGVPVIEAQAAGCPVIVSDFSAQTELAGPGYKIPIAEDDYVFSLQMAHYCQPRCSEIIKALEWAYEHRGNEKLRTDSRAFALDYDHERCYRRYTKSALAAIGEVQQAQQSRTAQRRALRQAKMAGD